MNEEETYFFYIFDKCVNLEGIEKRQIKSRRKIMWIFVEI